MEKLEERLAKIEAEKKLAYENLFYAIRDNTSKEIVQASKDYHLILAEEYGVLYREYHDERVKQRRTQNDK